MTALTPVNPADYMDRPPCPRCLPLAFNGVIYLEHVQPLPPEAEAPLATDGTPCCYDCQSADTLMRVLRHGDGGLRPRSRFVLERYGYDPEEGGGWSVLTFPMARVCVGNDRSEQLRLPGMPMGLVLAGIARASEAPDDRPAYVAHHEWLEVQGLIKRDENPWRAS